MAKGVIIFVVKTHSGKSTFGKLLHESLPKSVLIDNDEIELFVKTQYQRIHQDPEIRQNRSFENLDLKIRIQREVLKYTLQNGYIAINCSGNLFKEGRAQLRDLARTYGVKFIMVYFNYPDAILKGRIKNSARSTKVLNTSKDFSELLEKQGERLQVPSREEADAFFEVVSEGDLEEIKKQITLLLS